MDCLVADINTCGVIGANNAPSIFYSYGVVQGQVGTLRDQVVPEANYYVDCYDTPYWQGVIGPMKATETPGRLFALIVRSAEAYAQVASGEILVFVENRLSVTDDGTIGIFQTPKLTAPKPNIWQTYELPILQRSPTVTRIVSIVTSENYKRYVDWENGQSPPGMNFPLLPLNDAMSVPVPPVPAGARKYKRDGNDTEADAAMTPCPVPAGAAVVTSSLVSPLPTSKPSCVLHEQDPDQGITQAFCLCDSTATLPPLSVASTGHQTDSCAYTTIPATAKETITIAASTYTKNCQGCTQVGFNAPNCTPVPKCIPISAEVTVQAGSSPVHIGTLTGTALYTSVSSALEKLCPAVTQTKSSTVCETGSVTVPNIEYVSDESLDSDGELVIKVAASLYNSTTLRDAMIKSAALTAQKGSEQTSSCSNQTYTTLMKRDRRPLSRIYGRMSGAFAGYIRDRPEPVVQKGLFCNTAAFAGVGYFSAEWRQQQQPGAEAYIDATWDFQAAPGGDFLCDFIEDLEVGLAVVAPEFVAGDLATVPEIQAFCGGALDE